MGIVRDWRDVPRLEPVSATCDGCGVGIRITEYGFDDALSIHLEGGYGMYFDPFPCKEVTILFCKACADSLRESVPSVERALGFR